VDRVEKDLVLEMARIRPGEKALDVGCGTGNFSFMLAQKGLEVVGLDISPHMLKQAWKKAEGENISLEFVQGNIYDLPFNDETFDLVLSVTAFEFLSDPKAAASEAWRCVKPGGRLLIAALADKSPWTEFYREKAREENSVFN